MAIYNTGTAKTTAGSDKVTGTGTAWKIALVNGGMFSRAGMSVPIASVESDTDLTLAYEWPGTTATTKYAIDLGRAEAASAIAANRRLAELVAGLDAMTAIGADLTNAADAQTALAALGLSSFVRGLMDEADGDAFLKAIGAERTFRVQSLLEIADATAEEGQREINLYGGAGKTGKGQLVREAGIAGALKLNNPDGAAKVLGKSGFGLTVHEDGAVSVAKNPILVASRNTGQETLSMGFNYGVLAAAAGVVRVNVGGWTFAVPPGGVNGRAAYVPKSGYYMVTLRTYVYANMAGRRLAVSKNGAALTIFTQATGNNEGNLFSQNVVYLSKGDWLGYFLPNGDLLTFHGDGHTELTAEWIGEIAA